MTENALLATSLFIDAFRDPYAFAFLSTVLVLLIGYWSRHNALAFFATIAVAFGTTHIAKSIFKIPRPEESVVETTGYRFPSLHAAIAAAILTSFLWYAWQHFPSLRVRLCIGAAALAGVALVMWSRVYLNVHEPIDVFVGALIGMTVSIFIHFLSARRAVVK